MVTTKHLLALSKKVIKPLPGGVVCVPGVRIGEWQFNIDGDSIYISTFNSGAIDTVMHKDKLDTFISALSDMRKRMR